MTVADSKESFASDARWLECVLEHFGAQSGGRLISIVSAGKRTSFAVCRPGVGATPGFRVLELPNASSLDLSDAGIDRSDCISSLEIGLKEVGRFWEFDTLRAPRVRTRSNLLAALPGSIYSYALSDAGASAFCDVSSPDALKAISKENLRNVERGKRRAERDVGPVAIESVTDASVCTTAFDRFCSIEGAGWKGAQGAGTSLASDTRAQAFFRDVARRFQEDGRARIDFLTIGGRDAACQLGIRAGTTWFLLKIGYHPDFKDFGPGGVLLKAFIDEMAANPDIFEVNLTANPPWAARWHFQTEPVYHVHIYNTTWRGRLLYAGRTVKEAAKVVRDRWQSRKSTATKP